MKTCWIAFVFTCSLLLTNCVTVAQDSAVPAGAEKIETTGDNLESETSDSDHGAHGPEQMKPMLLLGTIAVAVFTFMIWASVVWKHKISFWYHGIFIGLICWGYTINPEHFIHELTFSGIAVVAILGIVRVARGVKNVVDFSELSLEQTKAVIWALGPVASLITTPAAGTTLKQLRSNLPTSRDKCIAMHWLCNVGGGVGVGDFPFLFVWMTFAAAMGPSGIWAATLWQMKVMIPVMIFHMFVMMPIIWEIRPRMIWRNIGTILRVAKGFRYDWKLCFEFEEIEEESKDTIFGRFVHFIHASEEEAEVKRVFTAQALAIGLLVPFAICASAWMLQVTGHVQGPATGSTAIMTMFADNYAATATFWTVDNIIALMMAIVMGAAFLYGNMANLSFLGNTITKAETLKHGVLVWPTAAFGLGWHFYVMPVILKLIPAFEFLNPTLSF